MTGKPYKSVKNSIAEVGFEAGYEGGSCLSMVRSVINRSDD